MPVTEKTPIWAAGQRCSTPRASGGALGGQFASEKPGEFIAPHGLVVDSHGDVYVERSPTPATGFPTRREMRSFQKFKRAD